MPKGSLQWPCLFKFQYMEQNGGRLESKFQFSIQKSLVITRRKNRVIRTKVIIRLMQ